MNESPSPLESSPAVVPIHLEASGGVELRSAERRELAGRIVPYNETAAVGGATERMARGVFSDADPSRIRLRWEHRETIGRAVELEDRADGLYGVFRVPPTDLGDRALTLASEGIVEGFSVGFIPSEYRYDDDGARVHTRAELVEVSVVTFPAYRGATVAEVRSGEPEQGGEPLPEPIEGGIPTMSDAAVPELEAQLVELREQIRRVETAAATPAAAPRERSFGDLSTMLLRSAAVLAGDASAIARSDRELEQRMLTDVTTDGNPGLIPTAYQREVLQVVEPFRPFISSVRRITTPASGTTISFPRVTGKPTVAVQSAEKAETDAGALTTEWASFDMVTLTAASDLSIQLILRSDPSARELFLAALLESYGYQCDYRGLLAFGVPGPSGPVAGGTLDPNDSSSWVGASWENAYAGKRTAPDTIWMTPEVAAAFVNAVDVDGRPLYPTLNPTNAGGVSNISQTSPIGSLHGLRAIVVPAMAETNVPFSALVGPSSAYGFAEDGTYTLEADRPGNAGRDVGLAGMVWLMPLYVRAFTAWQFGVTAAAASSKSKS